MLVDVNDRKEKYKERKLPRQCTSVECSRGERVVVLYANRSPDLTRTQRYREEWYLTDVLGFLWFRETAPGRWNFEVAVAVAASFVVSWLSNALLHRPLQALRSVNRGMSKSLLLSIPDPWATVKKTGRVARNPKATVLNKRQMEYFLWVAI